MDSGLAGVILAAGASSRMGRDKALLPWPPRAASGITSEIVSGTILSSAIQSLSQFCDLVIVVAGNNEKALEPVTYGGGAFLVRNPDPDRGQFSSLQTGLREVLNRGRGDAMVTLVDRPPASAATLSRLAGEFQRKPHGVWAIVPEYRGKHGHPILIGREMIEAFLRAPVGANAREIEHANQERIAYVAVEDAAVAANVDTPEEYENQASGVRL